MPKCCFKFCKNKRRSCQNDGITYFGFPGQLTRRQQWIDIVRQQRGDPCFEPNSGSVVCEKHFSDSYLNFTAMGMKRLQNTAVPNLDSSYKDRKEEDDTKLTIFENPFLPITSSYHDDFSDTSDASDNCDEIGEKIKMDTGRLTDMSCAAIKQEIEDENIIPTSSCDDPSQPGTSKLSYNYSSVAISPTENSDEIAKKTKMDTAHQDMICVEIKKEIKTENSIHSSCEDTSQPGTSKLSHNYSSHTIGNNSNEIEKKIKIEVQELSPTITDFRLEDLMSIRDNRYEKFGEYVATMLKRMPLQKALDLQPQIVNLITSTMSDVGDGPRTLRVKTEGKET